MAPAPRTGPRPGGVVGLVVLIAGLLLLGRWLFAPDTPDATPVPFDTSQVVVVGVEAHPAVTGVDRAVLEAGAAQLAVLRVPTGPDQCAAAGWASLGAGEVVETGPICHPEVTPDGAIDDWHDLQEYADGRLGTLAGSSTGCVAGVGPGAALAATRADGTVSVYTGYEQFAAAGAVLECPLTFIAAPGPDEAEPVLTELAGRDDVTVIVAGLGPDHGGARPQLLYVTGGGQPSGLLLGDRNRAGQLDPGDLSAALRAYVLDPTAEQSSGQGGRPLRVVEGETSPRVAGELLRDTRNLTDREALVPIGLIAAVALMVLTAGAGWWRRRSGRSGVAAVVAAVLATWPAGLLLAGALGWWRTDNPALFATLGAGAWTVAGTVVALLVARWRGWPVWLAGVVVTVLVGVAHAWIGLPWLTGSLLDLAGDASGTATAFTAGVLVLLGNFGRRWWAGLRRLAVPWLTLVVAAVGAAAVFWRVRAEAEWAEHLMILLGLGAWTVVHAWLAPGPARAEFGLPGLRVPVLVATAVIAVVAPDPVWAWLIGALTFASVAAAARITDLPEPLPAEG